MPVKRRLRRSVFIIINAVIECIDKQPLNKINSDQLAAEFNISRKVLQKGFKEIKGIGIKEYHNNKRMEESRVLLKQGHLSVKQVAMVCLFKSQRSFSSAFKRTYFMTPTEYQDSAA